MSFFTNNILLQRIFFMKRRCVVFFPSIFRQMSDIVGDRTVNVSDATVKLFVDSGVNLGGNDSLFSTGGKNSAHNISAISGGIFAFFTDISLGNL